MKLLFFNSHPEKFGSQMFLVDLLEALGKTKEFECSVLTSFYGDLNTVLTEKSIENRVLPMPVNLKYIFHSNKLKRVINILHSLVAFPIYTLKLHTFLKKQKYDVLYNNNIRTHIIGSLASMGLKTKVILHIHGMPEKATFRHYLSAKLANKVVFNSQHSLKKLSKKSKHTSKFTVVYNGIDYESYASKIKKPDREGHTIGVIGAIRKNKGQIYAIKAFAETKKISEDLKMNIIGEQPTTDSGKYMLELRKELINEKIERSVKFTGYMDIKEAINSIDILLLPTLNEAFGRVIIEAMAMKIPVIASDVGGVPEIIQDGVNGILVPAKDTGAITEALIKVMSKKHETGKMVENGVNTVLTKFSMESMITNIISAIKSTV